MTTARAFLGTAAQGISYNAGVWHHSLLTVDGPLDYCLVETQIGDGSVFDVEKYTPSTPYAEVQVPAYTAIPPVDTHIIHAHEHSSSASEKISNALSSVSKLASSLGVSTSAPQYVTRDNFAAFGQVISANPDPASQKPGDDIQVAPDGKTTKYARLADITHSYPADSGAVVGISVFRATPKIGLERGKEFGIKFLERHAYTSQAFVPMGKGEWKYKSEEALPEGGQMLVIVAQNGPDDRPDPKTIQSFIVPSSVGISYNPGVWRESPFEECRR